MLIFLPLVAFGLLLLLALGEQLAQAEADRDVRGPLLVAAIGWGALVVTFSEGLGLFDLIGQAGLSIAWGGASLLPLLLGWKRGSLRLGARLLRSRWIPVRGWDLGLAAGIGALGLLLLAVAIVAPPNNVDSLLYHMSRVMHWAQNGSLRNYATGYHHQLIMPPWAELAILNLRVMWGDDRPANLVQWFAWLGSALGVSGIARLLGAKPAQQVLAAAFAATVPMAVLQATSTQNDLVVAFWAVCCAYLVILQRRRALGWAEQIALGLSFGLGLLTKITFVVYALPLAALYVLSVARDRGWRRALTSAALVGAIACALNVPLWLRNLGTYGTLYGPADWTRSTLALPRLLDAIGFRTTLDGPNVRFSLASVGGALLLSAQRVAQAAALNLVTPSSALNRITWSMLDSMPKLFDAVVSDSLANAAWSHEDTAGSPAHLSLALLAAGAVLVFVRRFPRRADVLAFAAMPIMSFVLLPLIIQRGSSGFGIRYQLPFFILTAPLVALAASALTRAAWTHGLALLLLVVAVPYMLFNNTRPVIGRPPWPTRVRSVFVAGEAELLFAANSEMAPVLGEVAEHVRDSGCREVGLRLDSGDLEYQLWWLLDAPQSGVRLETVYTYPSLEHLLDREFRPCMVICTICSAQTQLAGFALRLDRGFVRLYERVAAGAEPRWTGEG